ncbi:SurA N-terminal domain-containing protein [Candidatus Shikimatogenerans silvanidophilus]|uniref:SurA N-terminal domain-containing protein n=1 Tax=Candidatus Shikimatogenerans silvanidophilus TaxID=2782547 RepID=UPI001BA8659D|nr:SurA N-terminal domain-containing protein [Candidatus Shikimatogenerans silvanidophilus]
MIIYFLIYFFIFLIIFSFFSSFLFNAKIIFFLQKNKKKIIGKIKNSEILQKDYNYYLINKKNFNLFKNKNFIKKFIWNKLIKEKLLSKEINLGIEIPKNINKNIINKKYKKYYKNKFLNIYYKIIKEKELLNKENFDIIKYGLFNNKHIIENYNYFYEKNNYVNFDYISLSFDKEKKFFLQNWFLPKKKKEKLI